MVHRLGATLCTSAMHCRVHFGLRLRWCTTHCNDSTVTVLWCTSTAELELAKATSKYSDYEHLQQCAATIGLPTPELWGSAGPSPASSAILVYSSAKACFFPSIPGLQAFFFFSFIPLWCDHLLGDPLGCPESCRSKNRCCKDPCFFLDSGRLMCDVACLV